MSTPGQAVGGLVGAVAGFFLGGGPMGAVYGAQAGLMLGGMLDPPKGPTIDGPGLDDLTVQTSTYGANIPRVYATAAVNGNVFWLENNALKRTVTKKKSGGKGGGSTTTTRVKTYSATFAVGLCKGPIVGVRRIWIRGGLYYDAGSSDPGTIQASNAAAAGFHVYLGTDTQSPDARMQATLGAGNTPAWRGLAYIVFYDLQLAKYGNSLMGAQVRVEVMTVSAVVSYAATLVDTPNARSSRSIASNGAIFCAVTDNGVVVTSSDGLSWAESPFPYTETVWKVIYNGSKFCAVGQTHSHTSTDGLSWSSASHPAFGSSYDVAWNGTLFVSVGYGNTFYTSTDGLNWTSAGVVSSGSNTTKSIAFNGSIFAAYSPSDRTIYTSSNGTSWTAHVITGITTGAAGKIGAIGSRFVLMTADSKTTISDDNWSSWATSTTSPTGWGNCLVSGGSALLTTGNNNTFGISYDGLAWTSYSTGYSTQWHAAAYNGSVFACVAYGSNKAIRILPFFVSSGASSLDYVVSAECLQSGILTAGDIDVTGLAGKTVRGYTIASSGSIRSAIEPLQAGWPFDVRQHGYKIQFVPRGGSSVVTIPASDLDARDAGAEPGVQITTSREMDSQLPRRVTVNYLDADREYNRGTQYAERLTTPSINALTLDLPIVLTSTEGAGKAEVLLYLYWLERHDVSITLPPTYLHLEPGDVVTLTTPEGNVALRLTATNYSSDGRVECKAKYASAAIYTPTAVASAPAVTGPTTITPVGASVYALLDVPQVSTAQSGPSFLSAMTGALSGWDGGVLMQSTDAGATWAQLQAFDSPGSTLGTASNSLGVVDSRVIDSGSLLNVTLTQGALYSITQLAMFSGQNLFAYGVDGRWEIIAAQTCTLVSGTSYALRDLLRGRFGTEWAMGLHAAGDTIVLLDTTDVALISMGSGAIGLSYLYRGITVDRDISTDSNRTFSYQGVNLKPLSPIALAGARDPSSNDWSLTWIRRTREGGEWRDNVDASLGETSQVYQIDVFADGTYATVKRTITTSTPDAAYSSADQVADFGANQATLYLKIYQLSSAVGRGYPLTQSLTG